MLDRYDATGFQQKPNIHPTQFFRHHNTNNPAHMALWDVYSVIRILPVNLNNLNIWFNTLHPSYFFRA